MAMRALVSKLRTPVAASSRRSFRSFSTASQGQPDSAALRETFLEEHRCVCAMRDAIIEKHRLAYERIIARHRRRCIYIALGYCIFAYLSFKTITYLHPAPLREHRSRKHRSHKME
ncbi:uncharacterized protein LOC107304648 [Oryza brachyantha]|uniref:uncharacterized protein LOC107304648 n=1 Tax=Oryza brachyantha TaxID=4533 RepID=UPI000776605B|nr:uncharacterized protein LOC107304648 [Oryza brachyantha]